MARKVFISSDISHDEDLIEVCEEDSSAALLWPWILTCFDDWGRAQASPKRLKAEVFPAIDVITVEAIEKSLKLFDKNGLITLYQHEGKPYMCIDSDKWFKYQTHIRSSKRENDNSKHPAPSDESSAQLRDVARSVQDVRAVDDDLQPSPSPSLSPSLSKTVVVNGPNPFELFQKHEFGKLDPVTVDLIEVEIEEHTEEWVRRAMVEAIQQKVCKWSYVKKTLKNWNATGHEEPWTLERPKGGNENEKPRGIPQNVRPFRDPKASPTMPDDELDEIQRCQQANMREVQ